MDPQLIGLIISGAGLVWAVVWGIFVFRKRRTAAAKPPGLTTSLVTTVTAEQVAQYDPKTKAVIDAAGREARGVPVGMATGPSANALRWLAAITAVLATFALMASLLFGRAGFGGVVQRILFYLALISGGTLAALVFFVGFGFLLASVISGIVRLLRIARSLRKTRRIAALALVAILSPAWLALLGLFATFVLTEQMLLCFLAFHGDEALERLSMRRFKRLAGGPTPFW